MAGLPLRPVLPRSVSGPATESRSKNINAPVDPHELSRRLEAARLEKVALQLRRRSRSQALNIFPPQSQSSSSLRIEIVDKEILAQNVAIHQHNAKHDIPNTTGHSRTPTLAHPPTVPRPPTLILNPELLLQSLDAFQRRDLPSPEISPMVSTFPRDLDFQFPLKTGKDSVHDGPSPNYLSPQAALAINNNLRLMDGEISPAPVTPGMFPAIPAHNGANPGHRPRSAPLESVPVTDYKALNLTIAPGYGAPPPVVPRGSHGHRPSEDEHDVVSQSKGSSNRPSMNFSRRRSREDLLNMSRNNSRPTTAHTHRSEMSKHDSSSVHLNDMPEHPKSVRKRGSRAKLRSRAASSPERPFTAPQPNPYTPNSSRAAERFSIEAMTPESLALLREQEKKLKDLRKQQDKAAQKIGQDHSRQESDTSISTSMLGDSTAGMTKSSLKLLREKEELLRGRANGSKTEKEIQDSFGEVSSSPYDSREAVESHPTPPKVKSPRSCLCFWR